MAERLRGSAGVKQRTRRMARTNWLCEMCRAGGVYRLADVVDHVKPLAKGGPDTDDNTQNLCTEHHDLKTRADFGQRAPKPTIGADGWPITPETR